MSRILVAMSGGVDSAVAAALLVQEGHEVVGATLKLWCYGGGEMSTRSCCSLRDIDDARASAKALGIKHYVLDEETDFENQVITPFINSYLSGETPNPCVSCNTYLKFGGLLQRARSMGFDAIATGHYAQLVQTSRGPVLHRGADPNKDQSYVLWGLKRSDLAYTRFPVGSFDKEAIRRVAVEASLPVADKIESQDICFVEGKKYGDFVLNRAQNAPQTQAGQVIDTAGNVIGDHRGVIHYTLGQRRGLGMAFGEPKYIVGINAQENQVVVGDEKDLLTESALVRQINWVSCDPVTEPRQLEVKIRYRAKPVLASFVPGKDGTAVVSFKAPQRAVTPGQTAAFYAGDVLLGGGIISR